MALTAGVNSPEYSALVRSNPLRIKTAFVSEVLKSNAEAIRQEQTQIVDDWDLFESGALRGSLQGHFSVNNTEGGAKLSMRYLVYARFLDMKRPGTSRARRDAYHLYNRVVFGFLYGQILPSLRFGFTDDVKSQFANSLAGTAPYKSWYMIRDEQLAAIKQNYGRDTAAAMAKTYRTGY